ncbi:PAS domain S-box protein [Lysinibacillus yapensis]|nr:PAS domain S-box protein [Lysinibacillus yapensis]
MQNFSKAQFDLLFNNSKDFVYYMKKNGEDFRYIFLNPPAMQLLSENAIGHSITEMMKNGEYQTIIDNYHQAIEKREQVNYQDYSYIVGEVKKYETTVIPIFEQHEIYVLAITKEIAFNRDVEDKYLFMRSVFSNTFLSTVLVSTDGRFLEANPQFIEDFNLNLEDARLKSLFELPFTSKSVDELKEYLDRVYTGVSIQSKLLNFVDKDGRQRSYTAAFSPLMQENNVAAVFIILQEITQFIQQEQELRTTSIGLSNFKKAINSAAEIAIIDRNGKILDVNRRFVEQTGFCREELIGNSLEVINGKNSTKEIVENIITTLQKGEIWRGELCNHTKKGKIYWTDTTMIPFVDDEGNIQQYISIFYDISDKKGMVNELRNIEQMFKLITENTNDLIVLMNKEGVILYSSSVYTRVLGYEPNELVGQLYTNLLTSDSKGVWTEKLLHIENQNHAKVELTHQSKTGDIFWTECSYTVVNDYVRDQGSYIILVAREITERKEIENQLLFLAFHDTLTHLPNRRYLAKEFPRLLEEAQKNQESLAVLYVDGDNFKTVNDQFGHDVGDVFIYEFGQALGKTVRGNDIVIRMGGDEFAIILTGLDYSEEKRHEQINKIINRINKTLKKGWFISNHHFSPTASIGIALYPDHGQTLEKLLECSDKALYRVKASSKNNFTIFENV